MLSVTRSSIFALSVGYRIKLPLDQLSRCKLLAHCTRGHNQLASDWSDEVKRNPRAKLAAKLKGMQDKPRPFALPNLIAISRLALTPAAGYFIINGNYSYAMACVATAWASDVADKTLAWLMNQRTSTLLALDFVADKAFIATCMICLAQTGFVPFWMMKGLAFREFITMTGALIYRYLGVREPSIGKMLDFHNYPMYGFEPNLPSRLYTSSLYALFTYYMYQASLNLTETTYGYGLFSCEIGVSALGCLSMGVILTNLTTPPFYSIPAKQ